MKLTKQEKENKKKHKEELKKIFEYGVKIGRKQLQAELRDLLNVDRAQL